MDDSIRTNRKQRKMLKRLANGMRLEVHSPIPADEQCLRNKNLIKYRARRKSSDPEISWEITNDGREYLQRIEAEQSSKSVEGVKWAVGIVLGLAAVLVPVYFGILDHPKVMEPKTDYTTIQQDIDTDDIEPGSVAVSEEPGVENETGDILSDTIPNIQDGVADPLDEPSSGPFE